MSDADWASLAIRLSVGLTMVAFGLHQILHPDEWKHYIPRWLERFLVVPVSGFMQAHGVGNLALGFCFAIGLLPIFFDWVVLIWWVSILPLAFRFSWNIGLRDLCIIASLVALILLHGSAM